MKLIKSALFLVFFTFVGCTHSLHMSHLSDFAPTYKAFQQGELIKAKTEQFTILGFVTDTNYLNEAHDKLLASCKNGSIQGISTQYSTSHGFLSWTNYIEIQALCIQ